MHSIWNIRSLRVSLKARHVKVLRTANDECPSYCDLIGCIGINYLLVWPWIYSRGRKVCPQTKFSVRCRISMYWIAELWFFSVFLLMWMHTPAHAPNSRTHWPHVRIPTGEWQIPPKLLRLSMSLANLGCLDSMSVWAHGLHCLCSFVRWMIL